MLDLDDLLNLILLTELELQALNEDIASDDTIASEEANDVVNKFSQLAGKLQVMYEKEQVNDIEYPEYEAFLAHIRESQAA